MSIVDFIDKLLKIYTHNVSVGLILHCRRIEDKYADEIKMIENIPRNPLEFKRIIQQEKLLSVYYIISSFPKIQNKCNSTTLKHLSQIIITTYVSVIFGSISPDDTEDVVEFIEKVTSLPNIENMLVDCYEQMFKK